MDLLIIGGTKFLGRALVEAAKNHGHQITLFNRGQTNPGLYPEVEKIQGDRKTDLQRLQGRTWDAVIDPSGYLPQDVRRSAACLSESVQNYTFISSISVYADFRSKGITEQYPVGKMKDETAEEVTGENYGPLKALCEQAVQEIFLNKALIIRPGLIVGPYDPTDRFTYWPYRVSQGGEVLAPGNPQRTVQLIDVRDLAEWTLRMVEAEQAGVFNANGPKMPISMHSLLDTCRYVSGSNASFTWVSDEFLVEHKVEPWMEMPLWLPESDLDYTGFLDVSIQKATYAGLTFRPLEETVQATLEWLKSRPPEASWRAGINREREAELLALWHQDTA